MNISVYKGTAATSPETGVHQEIHLDLNLLLTDFINGKTEQEIRQEIVTNGMAIRRYIFENLMRGYLPDIARQMGSVEHEGKIRYKSDAHIDAQHLISETKNQFHNTMQVTVNVQTDRPVTAAQALYMTRASIANLMADNLLNGLQSRYLGQHELTTHTETETLGDEVIKNDIRIERKSFRDN